MTHIIAAKTSWGSLARTLIFAVGHFFIDFLVVTVTTGAEPGNAAAAAIIAPLLNSLWYYGLDRAVSLITDDRTQDS